jgi:membrane protease YdiL (CAAX protease family)
MTIDATVAPQPRPWGIVMTVLWIVLAVIVMMIATLGAIFGLFPEGAMETPGFEKDARAFGILSLVAAASAVAVLLVAAKLAGWRVSDYLALVPPDRGIALQSIAILVVFVMAFDAITYLIGKDVVTPFQIDLYKNAAASNSLLIMWAALVIAAPVGEEIVFRGFLYRGWAQTPRAVLPAIVVISVFWAVIHTQYDWFGVFQIFLIGMLLGWARWRSGSTLLTIGLHALINAWATVQTIIKVNWL